MATLYETIRHWREAHKLLIRQGSAEQSSHQEIVDRLVLRLRRHRSLADLAAGYYDDGDWWVAVVREFSADAAGPDDEMIRDAAYFQRLLQLRRPGGK